jgi:hypothetical protein
LAPPNRFTKRTLQFLATHPVHFFALQIPQVVPEIMERLFMQGAEKESTLALLPRLIPYFVVASLVMTWTSAMTYVSVRSLSEGKPISFSQSAQVANSRWRWLFPAALLAGVTVLIGFSAYIIPGIILATLYLFVPQLIIDEGATSLMIYFNRSWKLARSHFLQSVGIVIVVTSISLLLYVAEQSIEGWLTRLLWNESPPQKIITLISTTIYLFATLVAGACTDVWVCCYYLKLKVKDGRNESIG